jgi:hypothetical protein
MSPVFVNHCIQISQVSFWKVLWIYFPGKHKQCNAGHGKKELTVVIVKSLGKTGAISFSQACPYFVKLPVCLLKVITGVTGDLKNPA